MVDSRIIKADFRGLNNLVKAMGDGQVVKVGIMGAKVGRKQGGTLTNAELGAVHEFGSITRKIPARSFLRMPIHREASNIVEEASGGAEDMAIQGDKTSMLKRIGIACENAIQRAFASRGFGSWRPDKPATIKRKKSSAPLIDTAQLRRSIASKVGKPQ